MTARLISSAAEVYDRETAVLYAIAVLDAYERGSDFPIPVDDVATFVRAVLNNTTVVGETTILSATPVDSRKLLRGGIAIPGDFRLQVDALAKPFLN